jgi:uncharacterized protein with HEPN domain
MPATDRERIEHMLDAVRKVSNVIAGRSRSDLEADDVLALALTKLVEIIGEAAKNVPVTTRERYPQVPWRQMTATRDRLIHGYFDVDLDVLWEIVSHDLPAVAPELEKILISGG